MLYLRVSQEVRLSPDQDWLQYRCIPRHTEGGGMYEKEAREGEEAMGRGVCRTEGAGR